MRTLFSTDCFSRPCCFGRWAWLVANLGSAKSLVYMDLYAIVSTRGKCLEIVRQLSWASKDIRIGRVRRLALAVFAVLSSSCGIRSHCRGAANGGCCVVAVRPRCSQAGCVAFVSR